MVVLGQSGVWDTEVQLYRRVLEQAGYRVSLARYADRSVVLAPQQQGEEEPIACLSPTPALGSRPPCSWRACSCLTSDPRPLCRPLECSGVSAHLGEELPVDRSLRPAAAAPDGEMVMNPPGLRGAHLTPLGDGETPLLSRLQLCTNLCCCARLLTACLFTSYTFLAAEQMAALPEPPP